MSEKDTVLIIGANGLLGRKLLQVFSETHQVVGTYLTRPIPGGVLLDITDGEQVRAVMEKINPQIVLLTAADTNVDHCEREHTHADAVNINGVAHIAAQCANRKLVFYSTEAVFDGIRGDYRETDECQPVNYYGKTKLRGEQIVAELPNSLILRTCMLYGDQPDSPRFINVLIRDLTAGKPVNAIGDLFATPTLIDDIAAATHTLVQRDRRGVYHVAGSSALSCYEMAMTAARVFGFDKALIRKTLDADWQKTAARPKQGTLNITKLTAEGIHMSSFAEGMQKIADGMNQRNAGEYHTLTACRICNGTTLITYLDLGNIPLVNRYIQPTQANTQDPRYPLQICYCTTCSLSQLRVVVNPAILYHEYFYRSSISRTFTEHCFRFAESMVRAFGLDASALVVDIASNDGCALREFQKFGVKVLGVDPAENLATLATANGIPTMARFWNTETAAQIRQQHGSANVITAMNVFAHVDDLHEFLRAVDLLLTEQGIFIIEVPYLVSFFNNTEFDTSYHEHLSYFLVKPLLRLFAQHDMEIFDIENVAIHGGSIRVSVKRKQNGNIPVNEDRIHRVLELEKDLGFYDIKTYFPFAANVENIKTELLKLLRKLREQGKVIAAYGASAKGNVLLNYCSIGKAEIQYIVDDTPEKQGLLTPGNHLPIVPSSALKERRPDYLLLLAWNFADELMEKTAEYQKTGGRYIIPIPNVRVV